MRADRLLSILLLLQVRGRITAGELAQRLEVSERTIYRDMAALGMAGVPVLAERGSGGGWMLLENYRTNLTGLNEAEIRALFLTTPPRVLSDLGWGQAAEAALIKLLAALPSVSRQGAEEIRQRIYVDTSGWRQESEAVPCLPTLQQAVWRERKVRFTYARGEGASERIADPLGLVAKGSTWYLIAAVEGEPRTYRISRMREAELLDEPATRPPNFDLAAYWERSSSQFTANLPRYPAVVRAEAELVPYLRQVGRYARIAREHPADAEGWARLEMIFEGEHNALEYVLSFGPRIEVIEPDELRVQVIQAAEATLARYAASITATRSLPAEARAESAAS
jgi:predicted DNA-binding transcriptional regulator YafY